MVKDLSNGIKFVNRSNEDESFINDIIKDLENPDYYKNVSTNDGFRLCVSAKWAFRGS